MQEEIKLSHYEKYKETIKACRIKNYYKNYPERAERRKQKEQKIINEYLKQQLIKNE